VCFFSWLLLTNFKFQALASSCTVLAGTGAERMRVELDCRNWRFAGLRLANLHVFFP
jgi:hypothetical protein